MNQPPDPRQWRGGPPAQSAPQPPGPPPNSWSAPPAPGRGPVPGPGYGPGQGYGPGPGSGPGPGPGYGPGPQDQSRPWGAGAGSSGPKQKGGRAGLALAAGALVVGAVVGAGVTAVVLRQNGAKNLDQSSVTAGVQAVLTGSYGLSTATAVSCPQGMTTKPGNVYTCTFTVGSATHTVKITVQNDAGQYQVGSPS